MIELKDMVERWTQIPKLMTEDIKHTLRNKLDAITLLDDRFATARTFAKLVSFNYVIVMTNELWIFLDATEPLLNESRLYSEVGRKFNEHVKNIFSSTKGEGLSIGSKTAQSVIALSKEALNDAARVVKRMYAITEQLSLLVDYNKNIIHYSDMKTALENSWNLTKSNH